MLFRFTPGRRTLRYTAMAILFTLTLACGLQPAAAINLNLTYVPLDISPSDPDGSRLEGMLANLETYISDIVEADYDLDVEFRYADSVFSGVCSSYRLDTNGRIKSAVIDLNTDPEVNVTGNQGPGSPWYYDTTPFDHSEYGNMTSYRAMDLPNSTYLYHDPENYFVDIDSDGNPDYHDQLEIAYQGIAAPGSPARGTYDMWTVLLHEMGHALGMASTPCNVETGSTNPADPNVTPDGDNDFDLDPVLAWGTEMAVIEYVHNHALLPHSSHCGGTNHRIEYAAADIFVLNSCSEWGNTNIDLQRQRFYSTDTYADFNDRANWEGYRNPDADDDAYVQYGGTATLSADQTVKNLLVSEGSKINTNANRLWAGQNCDVGDGTTIGTVNVNGRLEAGTSGPANKRFRVDNTLTVHSGSRLEVQPGWGVEADTFIINSGGTLALNGTSGDGSAHLYGGFTKVSGTIDCDGDAQIRCDIEFQSGANVVLDKSTDDMVLWNDATVKAGASLSGNGLLHLIGSSPAVLEDGAEVGLRTKVYGTLEVEADGIGEATIANDLTLKNDYTTLNIEINGKLCDFLDVTGTAYLDGTLEVDILAIDPKFGYTFTVMGYGSRVGQFDSILLNHPSYGLTADYGQSGITLTVVSAPVPEPGTLALLLGLLTLCILRRRRR